MDLTKRQQEIFDFIKRYSAKYGYPPTVRDIGKAVGLASSSTVHAHLANLERIGLLRRDPTKPRAIELLDRAAAGVRGFVNPGLPLVGHVAAGEPMVAEENIEEYIQTPSFAGGEDGEYLLRVRGESMKDVGILEDDLVVVRPRRRRRRRHRRRAGRGGGDRQAVLPGGRPRPPAARERVDGADPQPGCAGDGAGRRSDEEHLMTALALERPGRGRRRETGEPAPSLFDDVGGEPTLDEVLSGAWEGLAAHQHVACPVCGGEMTPRVRRARPADRRAMPEL